MGTFFLLLQKLIQRNTIQCDYQATAGEGFAIKNKFGHGPKASAYYIVLYRIVKSKMVLRFQVPLIY